MVPLNLLKLYISQTSRSLFGRGGITCDLVNIGIGQLLWKFVLAPVYLQAANNVVVV